MTRHAPVPFVLVALFLCRPARAETYRVGPDSSYPNLQALARVVRPGDVVEVRGGVTYPGDIVWRASGTADAPVVLRGIRVGGARPVLSGGRTTLEIRANHVVVESFEVQHGAARCVYHHGAFVTLRDVIVHDCPNHGILGADDDSGSLTLDYVEVRAAGAGDTRHPVYVATDEKAHPGSVFTMRHSYVHDARGGNAVKSRAERNRIYENWIEGARYHELELVGPEGTEESLVREDSDVVGNVFVKTQGAYVVRFGGDGTGQTNGRYRFVNNTVVVTPETHAVFRLFEGIESVEAHNNVFARTGGGPITVMRDVEARWRSGAPIFVGWNNWVPAGSSAIPAGWKNTLSGDDPGFERDRSFMPRPGSPLIDAGREDPHGLPGQGLTWALSAPEFFPPPDRLEVPGEARRRPRVGPIDVGALEFGAPAVQVPAAAFGNARPDAPPPLAPTTLPSQPAPAPSSASMSSGCGCRSVALRVDPFAPLVGLAACVMRRARRRRDSSVSAPPDRC